MGDITSAARPQTGEPKLIITASTLRDLLMCERRVWLDTHGDPAQREAITTYAMQLGIEHEQVIHAATAGRLQPITVTSWAEGVAVTRDLMQQRAPLILGAFLEIETPLDLTDTTYQLRGKVDRLARINGVYSPIEIKMHSKPIPADVIQLDFYVWLLDHIQGKRSPAELWLGANEMGQPRTRLRHEYDEERLLNTLARILPLLNHAPEPPIRLEQHCHGCPWYAACQNAARDDGNIDLLYNVPRHTRENMRRAGFVTFADIVSAPPGDLQRVKGIKLKMETKIRANAQAWIDNQPFWLTPLPDLPPGWMFDLETYPDIRRKIDVPWCMGWCDTEGTTEIALVGLVQTPQRLSGFPITQAPDSDGIWEVFAEAVSGSDAPIYHWSGYDAALLRSSAPAHVRAALEPRMRDLHAILKQTLSLPLKSTSIKVVSTYLGFVWPGHQDYRQAYIDYRYWLDSQDSQALVRASRYQGADVQSMAHVWRWLVTQESGG